MKTSDIMPCVPATPSYFLRVGKLVAVCATAMLACHAVRGQGLPFDSGSTGADGAFHVNVPFSPGRGNHVMAFDAARGQMVLFGGYPRTSQTLDGTWVWQGTDWILLNPSNKPPAVVYAMMTYDAARQEVVLFGGQTSSSTTNATWVWNGTNWTMRNPANKPTSVILAAMTYDAARGEVVLFGGAGNALSNDTWTWNGTNWTQRTPAGPLPTPRIGHGMVYDGVRQEVILFGGSTAAGGYLNDTWAWDGTSWSQRAPVTSPPVRQFQVMAYDPIRQRVVFFGGVVIGVFNDTWVWDGAVWKQQFPLHAPAVRYASAAAYDSIRGQVILAGGDSGGGGYSDTWAWDGTDWLGVSGAGLQTLDLSGKGDGTWNFTTINIPAGLTVNFRNNRGNTPVRWLASGDVQIGGALDLGGWPGWPGGLGVSARAGGPGGFSGGMGGTPSYQGSSSAGSPGQGPAGGQPGLTNGLPGQPATHASSYGSAFLQPLIGGSGGGGSAANSASFGNHGGGGGGAILLSSSRDIAVTGSIYANGGAGTNGSGAGSGGAIRLRAARITLDPTGRLQANNDGRIRLESYELTVLGTIQPSNGFNMVISQPVTNSPVAGPALLVGSVAGQNVVQPPGGDLISPDVIFTAAGEITVTIRAQNVPDGTPVKLRLTMTDTVINKPATGEPPVVLAGGAATFTLSVPKGRGSIQATAEFTTGN